MVNEKRIRVTLSESSPKKAKKSFKKWFKYDHKTGEITQRHSGRTYPHVTKKGYRGNLSRRVKGVEYSIIYHRLAWFLYYGELIPCNKQIDHIDNNKLNNRIINLRVVTNAQNAYKRGKTRKNSTTGYKGVTYGKDTVKGIDYWRYTASISKDGVRYKIGRFKDKVTAAKFYDAANRYLFGEFSNPNFETIYIAPQSVEKLRKLKKTMTPLSETEVQEKMDKLLETLKALKTTT